MWWSTYFTKENFELLNSKMLKNLSAEELIAKTLEKGQAKLTAQGALSVVTGKHTGRSAQDKYVVDSGQSTQDIWWENQIHKMTEDQFDKLLNDVNSYLLQKDELFYSEHNACAHKDYRQKVSVLTPSPHHSLFTDHMFRKDDLESSSNHLKDFLVIHAPDFNAEKGVYGNHSSAIVTTHFDKRITIIVGTLYAGEIKKSVFSTLNYELPLRGVLPMHSGVSVSADKKVSVFFGLSGTGKTTLSNDTGSLLVGDDEHGLCEQGVFNFVGGCYAKTLGLSEQTEPEIFKAASTPGALIENVILDKDNFEPQFKDNSITDNGRCSYPLEFLPNVVPSGISEQPDYIFFLTADAFGVLPPVARLDVEEAKKYFLLGYTAKLAGTEMGVKDPQATFSACFGAPFMLRHPSCYAELLEKYIKQKNIPVYLINTGWTEGPYGVGHRFPLKTTREIIRSVQSGALEKADFIQDDYFGLQIPNQLEGIDEKALKPWLSWKDYDAYKEQASQLKKRFDEEYIKIKS